MTELTKIPKNKNKYISIITDQFTGKTTIMHTYDSKEDAIIALIQTISDLKFEKK